MISFYFLGQNHIFGYFLFPIRFQLPQLNNTIFTTPKRQATEMDPTSHQPSPKATNQMTPLS